MDFLNNATAQLNDLFRSMTVGARITAGLLLLVVVVSLVWLFQHQVAGGDTYLLGGQSFSTSDLNAMESAFAQAGLGGYELEGGRVRIPRQQQAAYVAALAEGNALPANWNQSILRALESNSPFITAKEREDRLRIAAQQQLGLVLREMPDVANATVHYDSQKKSGFGQQRVATASVVLQMVGGRSLDEPRVQMIREMVAGYFAGLAPEKVIVSDLRRSYSTADGDSLGGAGSNHRYITTKLAHEKNYEQNILKALAYVPGVAVSVNAVLEKELHSSTRSTKHDPKVTAIHIKEEFSLSKSESAPRGGAPGFNAQQPPQLNQSARISESQKGSSTEEDRTTREEQNVANVETTERVDLGLLPQRVTVTVAVPSSYFEELYRRRNPTPEGQPPGPPDEKILANIEAEEIDRIRSHVVPLIPKPTNEIDPTPLVTVTKFEQIAQPELPAPSAAATALGWLGEHWSTLGLVALVLVSLVMMRSMVRSAPSETRQFDLGLPPPSATPASETNKAAELAGEPAKSRLKRRITGGKSLRDELSDMVREDPEMAANILRGWIGTGS